MWKVKVPRTLIVGYDDRTVEILEDFMSSVPVMSDVIGLPYKPKVTEMLNVAIMSPFPRLPLTYVLDVLDPFNVRNIASEYEVVLIATEDEYTLKTALMLQELGVETYFVEDDESIPIKDVVSEKAEKMRVPRMLNGLYVIPGHGKKVREQTIERIGDSYITETGCIVSPTLEEALRILNEKYL